MQLSFEGFSTAGPVGAYVFHGLGADPDVLDIAVDYFVVGDGELGATPLFSLGEAERMLCILRQVAPGWVILTLNFEYLDGAK